MKNSTTAAANEALSLVFLGVFLVLSLTLFTYQVAKYTSLLG